ncbi:DUF2637 domain-containing protein [Streptomyces canus]|uniref:DUF2637 domain-containing protein n=1 Tax=Streptomyces canus TaxID=58343 RepID=UPI00382D8C41
MTRPVEPAERAPRGPVVDAEAWARSVCALVVAAYASYVHQREFALQGGADRVSASLWPLSVDGLLLLATIGLLKQAGPTTRRVRWAVWSAFLLGIAVSLAANVAAAPAVEWKPVLVAGWPPVALLLSVELLVHRPAGRRRGESPQVENQEGPAGGEVSWEADDPILDRARMLDARHRKLHQRPASAETLRKELHVGAARSREITALIRGNRLNGQEAHRPTDRAEGRSGTSPTER